MGCRNQFRWVKQYRELLKVPVLEVGSKQCKHSQDYRSLFPGADYQGVDIRPGTGVDLVIDLATEDFTGWSRLHRPFETVLCLSVLEHCRRPWIMARHLVTLLASGGAVFISVPFAWRLHDQYGGDYWRFTPQGIRELFPLLDWDRYPGQFCTAVDGDAVDINAMGGRPELEPPYAESSHRYVIPPTMVNMIGIKP